MKRTVSQLCGGLFICALTSVAVWAQATAQISGTVKDQTGAVLPGVEITATQTDTGISRIAITNETGSYVLPNLAIGPYRLEVALPRFRTYVQTGIVLQKFGKRIPLLGKEGWSRHQTLERRGRGGHFPTDHPVCAFKGRFAPSS